MRISDLSSDVCSSYLPLRVYQPYLISDSIDRGIQISLSLLQLHLSGLSILTKIRKLKFRQRCVDLIKGLSLVDCVSVVGLHLLVGLTHPLNDRVVALKLIHQEVLLIIQVEKSRSEEHTSEIQSLKRSQYAVCRLKEKKNHT